MNHWQIEIESKLHRDELENQMKAIRLEEQALRSKAHQPAWYERSLYRLANWMIATGKQLRRRYEKSDSNSRDLSSSRLMRGRV